MQPLTIDAIPHRPPFRFVDEIIEIDDSRIATSVRADPEADFFRGHYPGMPVMPGVLLCECCFQAAALLIARCRGGYEPGDGIPVVTRIRDARFKRIVHPGDSLRVEVALDETLDDAFFMTGRIKVGERPIMRVGFACMLAHSEMGTA